VTTGGEHQREVDEGVDDGVAEEAAAGEQPRDGDGRDQREQDAGGGDAERQGDHRQEVGHGAARAGGGPKPRAARWAWAGAVVRNARNSLARGWVEATRTPAR
jgi:hypothetical protein